MTATQTMRVTRIEVRPAPDQPDPRGDATFAALHAMCPTLTKVDSSRIYLIQADLDDTQRQRLAEELLTDPVSETLTLGASPCKGAVVEVHYQPGVMDPVAQSTRHAIAELLADRPESDIAVRTGFRFDLIGENLSHDVLLAAARNTLANPVIQDIHLEPFCPESFPAAALHPFRLTHVPLIDLSDEQLKKLSRDGHLFLSLEEMKAVQDHFRTLQREPTDIELETLAQTWSEHCVHKTLKATIHYRHDGAGPAPTDWQDRPGHAMQPDGSLVITNLLKSTIAAATGKLMRENINGLGDWCVSVFEDNAGIVKFDNEDGIAIKVETHNHPSAIEPYGGAATGIGGCIRDIIGTGLAAKPIANTNVFCVAFPDHFGKPPAPPVPTGVLHPKRILQQVVAGVRDYGNRMGIPTVNGAVHFHDDYLGNPLVFAGCLGIIPLDKAFGSAQPGDRIIVLGGATGRDGIHGATFSSAELTDTHADEFSHAVQIGNPITEKQTLDVILQARDATGGPLYHAITDCGAGGFSSAVGEMGEKVGAIVQLDQAPLKYQGLTYTEIWISEAQERMVLAVPPDKLNALKQLCDDEDLLLCDLGSFGQFDDQGQPELILRYHEHEVGRLSMPLLHDGIPTPTRVASSTLPPAAAEQTNQPATLDRLINCLSDPNVASKHWIIRQYDHEVQGGSVIKPLVGLDQQGPGDAAVIRPKLASQQGLAIGCGLCLDIDDAYWMALASIDEAVRNLVCVGADPKRIALLDNFCWPGCENPEKLGSLVRAAQACYDGAIAYRSPFVSGKDSLNNQFTTEDGRVIAIPATLLITAMGLVPDVIHCQTMDAKQAGNRLVIVGITDPQNHVNLTDGPAHADVVHQLIRQGLVRSVHDCSEGGIAVAAAEMAFAGGIGLELSTAALPVTNKLKPEHALFTHTPSRYLLEVAPDKHDQLARLLDQAGVTHAVIGQFTDHQRFIAGDIDTSLDHLRETWRKPLDW